MDEQIQQFVAITGASANRASFFLESANGDLETAMSSFYESEAADTEASPSAPAEAAPAISESYTRPRTFSGQPITASLDPFGSRGGSESSTPSRRAPAGRSGGISTFRDLQASSGGASGDEEGDDKDDPFNFYTGGERSALSVENPEARRRRGAPGGDLVNEILKKAAEAGQGQVGAQSSASAASSSAFAGRGRSMNDATEEEPAAPIPGSLMPGGFGGEDDEGTTEETAIRNLTFWQDGFSIEDGELMRYDDPAHAETLNAINAGRAPLSLLNVRFGQPVELRVSRRTNEKYTPPPPPRMRPFGGSGNRLGSPAVAPSTSAPAPATSVPQPTSVFEIDSSQPVTQIQIRLGDGQKMVGKFNHSHTVADIRSYINSANPGLSSRDYVLQASFPPKPFSDESLSIKDAGLINAVVIQKFQ